MLNYFFFLVPGSSHCIHYCLDHTDNGFLFSSNKRRAQVRPINCRVKDRHWACKLWKRFIRGIFFSNKFYLNAPHFCRSPQKLTRIQRSLQKESRLLVNSFQKSNFSNARPYLKPLRCRVFVTVELVLKVSHKGLQKEIRIVYRQSYNKLYP